jgi:hypothetical protein
MRWLRTLLVSTLCLSGFAQAEPCTFEYRITDLAEISDRLKHQARSKDKAVSDLAEVLNRLGGQGWELVSEHAVAVYTVTDIEAVRDGNRNAPEEWVAALQPSAALWRRTLSCSN